jgi:hypothetical protein
MSHFAATQAGYIPFVKQHATITNAASNVEGEQVWPEFGWQVLY